MTEPFLTHVWGNSFLLADRPAVRGPRAESHTGPRITVSVARSPNNPAGGVKRKNHPQMGNDDNFYETCGILRKNKKSSVCTTCEKTRGHPAVPAARCQASPGLPRPLCPGHCVQMPVPTRARLGSHGSSPTARPGW